MKGDITIRPLKDRDARLHKIAARHETTLNQIIGLCAMEISRISPDHLYQCLAAISERSEQLRQNRKKPVSTDKHQN